jgi:serine protease Do
MGQIVRFLIILCGLSCGLVSGDSLPNEAQAVRSAVESVAASVVRIETFAGAEQVGEFLKADAPTSGLVVSPDGYVISSEFNFATRPASILVTLADGKRLPAVMVARDHSRHIVLLKVDPESELPVAPTASRSEMKVGQWTIAVGRTFEVKQVNTSVGILSATNRIWGKAIQTDAKISPNNYGGPLIDIRGRVLGILVPMSTERDSVLAGAELYDSGIGFAVPLEDIEARLEHLKSGTDLYRGILGISLKSGDLYAAPEVGVVSPNSPAYKAGVKSGDIFQQINGRPVSRQVHLQHVLGPLYAGDTVDLVVKRGEQQLNLRAELTDKLEPYQQPFLGVLPRRAAGDAIIVRHVFAGSPAEAAGLLAGDQITKAASEKLGQIAELRNAIAGLTVGETIQLTILRGGVERQISVTLDKLPESIPGELPPPTVDLEGEARPAEKTGVVEVKLPEESGSCMLLVPDDYDHRVPQGLIVWLTAPGKKFDSAEFESTWKELAAGHDFLVLAPQPKDAERWLPAEVMFIRKLIESVFSSYTIDRNRVVVHGQAAGGAMAFLIAFAHREVIRGVAVVDSPAPAGIRRPETDPVNRLAVLLATSDGSSQKQRIERIVTDLRESKFPVTVIDIGPAPRDLDASERAQLARWVDALDRI